jgi:hypothetical protein
MPLIKPRASRVPVVRHVCRLRASNRDALVAYARFIGDTPDYVLNQLLETTLCKDKDFVAWQASEISRPVADSLATNGSTRAEPTKTPRS